MKIARIETEGTIQFVARYGEQDGWRSLASLGVDTQDTAAVIAAHDDIRRRLARGEGEVIEEEVNDSCLRCPIVQPSKILAIGLNYADHIREMRWEAPPRPMVFTKWPNSLNDPAGHIVIDDHLTREGDYEAELAVVIGRRTRGVQAGDALDRIYGYAIANDVSARDGQREDGQFDRSKGFDTFCPVGPWITTADEVPDPQSLRIRSIVNGETRQDSSTKEMLFTVAELVAYISRGTTLEAGDLILTGTPHGVGTAMQPPQHLRPGDEVVCEIEVLGRICNKVVSPPRRS